MIERFYLSRRRFRRLRAAGYFAHGGSSSQSPLHSVSAWRRKLRSFPCSSSSRRTRFAGLRREQRGIGQNATGDGSDEHFVLIVALPTPSGPPGHLPLTGGVGPGPHLRGPPIRQTWRLSQRRGRPGVPPLRHSGGASGFAVGADDLGGPRAHTVRPYEEAGELPRRAGEDTRPYGRADIETVSFFS